MLNFWNERLQTYRRISQVPQSEDVNLKTCADLYGSLTDQLCTSRYEFERYEATTEKLLPGIDYKTAQTCKWYQKEGTQ